MGGSVLGGCTGGGLGDHRGWMDSGWELNGFKG
jgi:hypothetical protein